MYRILIFFLISTAPLFSQGEDYFQRSNYFSISFEGGSYESASFEFSRIWKKKYSFAIGFSGAIKGDETIPDDFVSIGTTLEFDEFELISNYNISLGRVFYLTQSEWIRPNIMLGLDFLRKSNPQNFVRGEANGNGFEYVFDRKLEKTVGLVFKPKIEFVPNSIVGLYISPTIHINSLQTYATIGIGIVIGDLD